MTNIFNKKVIAKNGTLEKNWLEERSLRDISGEGRYFYVLLEQFQDNIFLKRL